MSAQRPGADMVPHGRRRDDDGGSAPLSLADLLRQARDRIDREEFRAALALLEEALEVAPNSVPALIMTAYCHLLLNDAVQALEVARRARRYATGPAVAKAQSLLEECARTGAEDLLESVRAALRRGELGRAVALADEIVAARPEDDGIANIHAYVYERLASSPSAPARARARQGAARPLTPQALQKVLEWLAREELEEGAAAVEARDYVRAVTVLDRVNPIDDRGAKVGYLQAKAMYGSVVTELARSRPTGLAAAEENLRRAERLARRAATSPAFAYQAGRLLSEIEKVTQRVSGERRLRPIVEPFKALKSSYLGRTITYFEAAAFRRSLASLRVKVEAELRMCPGESVEARKLRGIRREILHLQGQLPYV